MDQNHHPTRSPKAPSRRKMLLFGILVPLLVLVVGIGIAVSLMKNRPEASQRPQTRTATLVEVRPVVYEPQQALLHVMGTVRPARQVELRAQAGGEIVSMSGDFLPGGRFRKGQKILTIDPTDYRLAIRQLNGEIARVEAELQLEEGNQLIARKEYALLGETISDEELALVLRRPQLANLQAALDAARAKREQAQVHLSRTEVIAPFNAVVQDRQADLGARVSETSVLATLIGTDEYWAELSIPVGQLRWIAVPGYGTTNGSVVRIFDEAAWGPGVYRTGEVVRLAAALEESGRMARLLVRIDDPLALKKENAGAPRMLVGAYVRAVIEGNNIPAAAAIQREFIRDGNTVWIMDDDGRLAVRPVEIAFRGPEQVLVTSGIAPGERLVISDLSTPVAGMSLRLSAAPLPADGASTVEARP